MTSVTVTSGIVNKKLMYWKGIFNENCANEASVGNNHKCFDD
jgi:hypothetical protein